MPIFTIARAVTLVILELAANKTVGAQELIMTNIHGLFYDFISNTSGAMHDTDFKMPILNISRAVTVAILQQATNKTPGTQQLIMVSIPGRFRDSTSNGLGATPDKNCKMSILNISRAITVAILQ